ncbi:hypothetical protein BDN72DRAFT_892813 [Pluteus cervinus]|uniref:Uncharacterized protein n=1 Tax=Pluteus cervinus TaxID=181527 RepID=A0ACD3B9G5_9AGAR|nr:hypothetical protein BDN72DRAFT_892813 [Pluteus cervinus]
MEQNPPTRGTKRKRYEPPKEDLATKIAGKLHHDVKDVRKAAKKAKTFETQKLVKRLKDLRNKNESAPEIADLESQLAVLKVRLTTLYPLSYSSYTSTLPTPSCHQCQFDFDIPFRPAFQNISHEVIANTAFKTKINKDKILLHNDHVQRAVSKELHELLKPADPGTASAKIQSRLLSSKALASVVVEAVTDLRNVIEPKPIKDEDESQEIDEADNNEDPHSSSSPSKVPPSKKAKRHPDPRREDGENGAIDAGWESGTVYSSDGDEDGKEEDGWESGSVHSVKSKEGDSDSGGDDDDDNDGDEDSERNALSDSNDFEGAEDSDDGESDSVNDSTSGGALPKKKGVSGAGGATKSVKSDKAPSASTSKSQSTFLPSLSVGFIRGDSDSEWSDSEAKVADLSERKNRRGQRARRA